MSNQTLIQILEAVRAGEKPEYDDLFYALRTMETLSTFRDMDLRRAAERSQLETLYERAWHREQRALHTSPKHWLGDNNDPNNPEVQKRQQQAKQIFSNISQQESE